MLRHFAGGAFDLIVSPALIAELEHVVHRPHIVERLPQGDAERLLATILRQAIAAEDPPVLHGATPDPKDDYLVSLARAARADLIISGDRHLTELGAARPRVLTPRAFVDLLESHT